MNWVGQLLRYGWDMSRDRVRERLVARSVSRRAMRMGAEMVQSVSDAIEDYLNSPQGVCPRCGEDFYTYSMLPSYWLEGALYTGPWPEPLSDGRGVIDAPEQYRWQFWPCGHEYTGEMHLVPDPSSSFPLWRAVRS